jgi:Tfp pilus assembly protein FimT
MTSSTGSRKSRTGLTLIELVLVMGLTLILLAVTAPRWAGFSAGRVLNSQADAMLAIIQSGQDRAAAEGTTYRVELDAQANTCRLVKQEGGTFVEIKSNVGRALQLPDGITMRVEPLVMGDDAEYIVLRPTGESTPVRITLENQSGQVMYVACRTALEPFVVSSERKDTEP